MSSGSTKLFVLAAVIAVGAIFLSLQLLAATSQPKIAWSPSIVYAGITSTTTITKTLTFTSDQVLRNITLEGVPPVAQFVQIKPNAFAQVLAGQQQTVLLTFSAPTTAQFGAYDGTIHIRAGSTTFPQTLKTSVTYAVVPLPPDPGAAGMQTLAGIDSDGDGVRDDVQRYIALTYPQSAKTRAALTQYAKFTQVLLLSTGKDDATVASRSQDRAVDCLRYVRPSDETALRLSIREQILNTSLRSRAYIGADARLSGGIFGLVAPGQEKQQCIFDPDSLPN